MLRGPLKILTSGEFARLSNYNLRHGFVPSKQVLQTTTRAACHPSLFENTHEAWTAKLANVLARGREPFGPEFPNPLISVYYRIIDPAGRSWRIRIDGNLREHYRTFRNTLPTRKLSFVREGSALIFFLYYTYAVVDFDWLRELICEQKGRRTDLKELKNRFRKKNSGLNYALYESPAKDKQTKNVHAYYEQPLRSFPFLLQFRKFQK